MTVAYSKRATCTAKPRGAKVGRKWVRWTNRRKADFLDHLAATCNVVWSAEAIGVDPRSVYNLRRHDLEFLEQWEQALACGYQLLETQLVGHALAGERDGDLATGDPAERPIPVELALKLLNLRRTIGAGKVARGGPPRHYATKEETDAAILKKLAVLEAKLEEAA